MVSFRQNTEFDKKKKKSCNELCWTDIFYGSARSMAPRKYLNCDKFSHSREFLPCAANVNSICKKIGVFTWFRFEYRCKTFTINVTWLFFLLNWFCLFELKLIMIPYSGGRRLSRAVDKHIDYIASIEEKKKYSHRSSVVLVLMNKFVFEPSPEHT